MACYHERFQIQSECRPTFEDVTDRAVAAIEKAGIRNGILMVYSQHTTCAVLIQEQSDDVDYYGNQLVLMDMVNGLSKLFPTCDTNNQYLHPGPLHIEIARRERNEEPWWSLNTDGHLRSVMLGRSVTIPIVEGEAQLGEFGRIYFADFDQVRARKRNVLVTVLGEEK